MNKIVLVVIFILNLPVYLLLLIACGPDCSPFYFETRGVKSYIAKKLDENTGRVYWEFVHGQSPVLSYDSLIVIIYPEQKEILVSNNGMYSTLACDPAINFQDEIKNINIYSDQDYNENFHRGDNLNILFSFSREDEVEGFKITDFMQIVNEEGLGLYHFLLTLNQPPDNDNSHNIIIELVLTDGNKYTTEIRNLMIRK